MPVSLNNLYPKGLFELPYMNSGTMAHLWKEILLSKDQVMSYDEPDLERGYR